MPSSVGAAHGRQTCVVHGNPNNPGNVRMTADRVALIDWDESHVDVPDLDLVLLYKRRGPRRRRTRHRGASVSRVGSCRLLGRRVRSLAARRSTSDLSASRDRPADYGVRAQRQRRPCSADALIRRADRRATTSVRLGASARACGDRR